ncbi:MAG: glycoside hydrolase family 9 protein [Clostridium sp.]|nr:glycoside hydrolase family 9 protein [Clostridium sp.]MCM1547077.1 glycoside hydrolase family 9 protein [Ruminococcus sp.]
MKKIIALAVSAVVSLSTVTQIGSSLLSRESGTANAEGLTVNYAEALQKSMFFYEVQQAGILPEWNEVSWREDSMVKEDGTPSDIVDGGWFDAGDHLKFTLTNAYAASVLGWGLMEYGDTVKEAGLYDLYAKNLKWGLDYVMNCDLGDEIIYMIGEGAFDHVWYGSPEVYIRKYNLKSETEERPYYTCKDSCIEAQMAAALATGYVLFKDSDPTLANDYLTHAKDLFKRADAEKILGEDTAEHSYYKPSTFYDDLMYAAGFLYKATGEKEYLDKSASYIPNLGKEDQSTELKFSWGFCWDDTMQGAILLYAQNTGDKTYIEHVKHHLDYWTTGYNGKRVTYTPDGHAWLMSWGSMRHMANTVMIAKIACDTILADDEAAKAKYDTWSKEQFDYAFGDNDLGLSYVVGMGEKNPVNIHHRGASGIHDDHWNELGTAEKEEDDGWQREYAHVLYGALEGGPLQDGTFKDENGAYEQTEVAIDYNAGFTAALCAFIKDYGGEPLADFPPTETPKWDEWQMAASLNGKGNSYTEIKAWAMNHTAWPARVAKDIKYRYYFDVSEVLAAGLSVDDITVKIGSQQYQEGQQGYATTTGKPVKYAGDPTGNTYYAEIVFEDGRAIMPTGQSEHRGEVQFRISIPDAINGQPTTGAWDPSNDWSYEGVEDAPNELKYRSALNEHITMYVDDVLVWGTEPDGTKPEIGGTGDSTVKGDTNCNGKFNVSDIVLLNQYLVKKSGAKISAQGKINADMNDDGALNVVDSVLMRRKLL